MFFFSHKPTNIKCIFFILSVLIAKLTQLYWDALRALALKNANAISKAFLAFQGSKTCASKNGKAHYCKFFCNSAIVQF